MSEEFVDYVMELLGPFGTVGARRMFGGHGLYLDGLMFAIVSDDMLFLKADEMNRSEYEQAGCELFGYMRKGRRAALNFFRAPDDAMESPERMLPWARTAYAAALRVNAKKQSAERARAAKKAGAAKEAAKPRARATASRARKRAARHTGEAKRR